MCLPAILLEKKRGPSSFLFTKKQDPKHVCFLFGLTGFNQQVFRTTGIPQYSPSKVPKDSIIVPLLILYLRAQKGFPLSPFFNINDVEEKDLAMVALIAMSHRGN